MRWTFSIPMRLASRVVFGCGDAAGRAVFGAGRGLADRGAGTGRGPRGRGGGAGYGGTRESSRGVRTKPPSVRDVMRPSGVAVSAQVIDEPWLQLRPGAKEVAPRRRSVGAAE